MYDTKTLLELMHMDSIGDLTKRLVSKELVQLIIQGFTGAIKSLTVAMMNSNMDDILDLIGVNMDMEADPTRRILPTIRRRLFRHGYMRV